MQALDPQQLEIRPDLWQSLAPYDGPGFGGGDPERFRSSAGYLFAPQDGARAVCELIMGGLLEPVRVQRLITIEHQDRNAMPASEVVKALVQAAFSSKTSSLLADVIQTELAERLMILAADQNAAPEVQALAWNGVAQVEDAVGDRTASHINEEIALFRRDPRNNVPRLKPSGAPPGPPI